jgi:hypothetical protein
MIEVTAVTAEFCRSMPADDVDRDSPAEQAGGRAHPGHELGRRDRAGLASNQECDPPRRTAEGNRQDDVDHSSATEIF